MSVLPATFGAADFGATPFGGAVFTIISRDAYLTYAQMDSTQSIRVYTDIGLHAEDRTVALDALNRFSWMVARVDGSPIPSILWVESLNPLSDATTSFRIHMAGPIGTIDDRLLLTGNPLIGSASGGFFEGNVMQFNGSLPGRSQPRVTTDDLEDLATGSDLGADGDLAWQSPRATIYKLVLRALTTVAGDFTYLPDYGASLACKTLATPTSVAGMVSRAKGEIAKIPGVTGSKIAASMDPTGILILQATVQTKLLGDVVVQFKNGGA